MRRVVLLPTSLSKPFTGAEFSLQKARAVRAGLGPVFGGGTPNPKHPRYRVGIHVTYSFV